MHWSNMFGLTARRDKRLAMLAAALVLVVVPGCKGGKIGGTMSPQDENNLGRQYAGEIEKQEKFVNDPELVRRVMEVAAPVFAQANKERSDVNFSVRIVDDSEVNAFSIPGGFIYINQGLLDKIGPDDDALACVIGHESAHVVRRHVVKQIADEQNKDLLVTMAAVLSRSDAVGQVGGAVAELQSLHFSRQDEYEADRYGLRYAYNAGYDPAGMLRTFRTLEEIERRTSSSPAYLVDHPVTRNRSLRALEELRELRANHGAYISADYDPQGDRLAAQKNGLDYNALAAATPLPPILETPTKEDKKDTPRPAVDTQPASATPPVIVNGAPAQSGDGKKP